MHHLKKWSTYPSEKKTKLILLLISKFAVFGIVFAGLMFLLRNFVSPIILIGVAHVIIFATVLAVLFVHMHKGVNHNPTQ